MIRDRIDGGPVLHAVFCPFSYQSIRSNLCVSPTRIKALSLQKSHCGTRGPWMRLVARAAVLALLLLLGLLYCLHSAQPRDSSTGECPSPERVADDAVRLLLSSGARADEAPEPQPVSFSVAVVLVVSLLSVALLITGWGCFRRPGRDHYCGHRSGPQRDSR